MDRLRSIFRNPAALLGTGFATFAAALFVAGLLTGGFSLAQEGTPTATQGSSTATATSGESTPEADATPSDGNTDKDTLRDTYLDTLAENLGVTREDLDAALKQTGLDMVDQALADGKITEEEATNIRERIESGEAPFSFPFGGHHRGHGDFRFGFHVGASLEGVANFLGIDVQDVTTALRNGDSLATVAQANGKTRDELKSYLVSELETRLDEAVANGRITQEKADEKLADSTDRIDELIDREGFPERGRGPGMHDDDANEGTSGTTLSPGDF